MKSKRYLEFREKFLDTYIDAYNKKITLQWQEEWDERIKLIQRQIETVISNIIIIQQHTPVKIGCIQISLLLSSLESGHPELMYEVYDAGKEFGMLLYAQTFQTNWFLADWEETKHQIEDKIIELNWQAYLGEEEVKAFFYENINLVLAFTVFAIKYEFKDFMTYKGAEQLEITEGFYLSMGEYRGWKNILYCCVESKDILQQGIEKAFSYMRFSECHYKERRLAGLKLAHTEFRKCVFLKMTFYEVDLQDADFEECVFRECVFDKCLLNGTQFRNCDMQRIEWIENQMRSGPVMDKDGGQDVFRPTVYNKCLLHKHIFKKNVIAGSLRISCDEEEVANIENEIL